MKEYNQGCYDPPFGLVFQYEIAKGLFVSPTSQGLPVLPIAIVAIPFCRRFQNMFKQKFTIHIPVQRGGIVQRNDQPFHVTSLCPVSEPETQHTVIQHHAVPIKNFQHAARTHMQDYHPPFRAAHPRLMPRTFDKGKLWQIQPDHFHPFLVFTPQIYVISSKNKMQMEQTQMEQILIFSLFALQFAPVFLSLP
jgi:hypothetical protein